MLEIIKAIDKKYRGYEPEIDQLRARELAEIGPSGFETWELKVDDTVGSGNVKYATVTFVNGYKVTIFGFRDICGRAVRMADNIRQTVRLATTFPETLFTVPVVVETHQYETTPYNYLTHSAPHCRSGDLLTVMQPIFGRMVREDTVPCILRDRGALYSDAYEQLNTELIQELLKAKYADSICIAGREHQNNFGFVYFPKLVRLFSEVMASRTYGKLFPKMTEKETPRVASQYVLDCTRLMGSDIYYHSSEIQELLGWRNGRSAEVIMVFSNTGFPDYPSARVGLYDDMGLCAIGCRDVFLTPDTGDLLERMPWKIVGSGLSSSKLFMAQTPPSDRLLSVPKWEKMIADYLKGWPPLEPIGG